jgi:mono/diheme cytochrome c family protein
MPVARSLLFAIAAIACLAPGPAAQRAAPGGWQLPADADTTVNPLPATEKVLARGREVYQSKCRRCHGPLGKGDGPEADPDRRPGDLSDPARAGRNPDGIIFYKVWNGRRSPDMPAFKSELERDDVWAVVHYAKQLRGAANER